jgi:hypothetical protein
MDVPAKPVRSAPAATPAAIPLESGAGYLDPLPRRAQLPDTARPDGSVALAAFRRAHA